MQLKRTIPKQPRKAGIPHPTFKHIIKGADRLRYPYSAPIYGTFALLYKLIYAPQCLNRLKLRVFLFISYAAITQYYTFGFSWLYAPFSRYPRIINTL